MQKLFSMFPRGAPGFALLLLRAFVGMELLLEPVLLAPGRNGLLIYSLELCAVALIIGIATPVVGGLAAVLEGYGLFGHVPPFVLSSFAPVVIASALTLLGPGAYSLDARLFGRRLVEFGPNADRK